MTHSLETIKQVGLMELNQNNNNKLEQLTSSKIKLDELKRHLHQILDAMPKNPSLLSRIANYWGALPLWQKISVGIVLIVPLLVIGILVQLTALITLSIVALFIYPASSLLLDNHYQHQTNNAESIKSGISSMATLLETVIGALETVHEQLAVLIEQLQRENQQLTQHIDQLHEHIEQLKEHLESLNQQIINLNKTEQDLRSTKNDLQSTVNTLKNTIQEQSQLLHLKQNELKQALQNYEQTQTQLANKVSELHQVKTTLSKQVDESNTIVNVLRETVAKLTNTVLMDEQQRLGFLKKMDEFITNKETSFDKIADRICEAEHNLAQVTNELKITQRELQSYNTKYKELLSMQKELIPLQKEQNMRLSEVINEQNTHKKPTHNPAALIKKWGIHAHNPSEYQPLEQPFLKSEQTLVAAY